METLANLQAGQLPQRSQRDYFIMNLRFLNREDELFSQIGMVSREPIVEKDMKQLPATYNFNELDQLAGKIAAKAINNNKFEISNGFIANGLNQFYRNYSFTKEMGLPFFSRIW